MLALGKRFSLQRKPFLQDAVNELILARQLTPARLIRRHALINLALAQVYFWMSEYPEATTLAIEALSVCRHIKSTINLQQIASLYHDLCKSTYGTSPRVARLGWDLSESGMVTL